MISSEIGPSHESHYGEGHNSLNVLPKINDDVA